MKKRVCALLLAFLMLAAQFPFASASFEAVITGETIKQNTDQDGSTTNTISGEFRDSGNSQRTSAQNFEVKGPSANSGGGSSGNSASNPNPSTVPDNADGQTEETYVPDDDAWDDDNSWMSEARIVVRQPEHGTLHANRTSAKEGDEVRVSVTPDSGYTLYKVVVQKQDYYPSPDTAHEFSDTAEEIAVFLEDVPITGGGSEYAFRMPELVWGNAEPYVTVKALFTPTGSSVFAFGTCGDNAAWTLDTDGHLIISGSGYMQDYIPLFISFNSASEHPLLSVCFQDAPPPWFDNREQVTRLTVSQGITYIGDEAFTGLWNLSSVEIAQSVTDIGAMAFEGCENLKELPDISHVEAILPGAFNSCIGLTDVKIPDSVTELHSNAFNHCVNLKTLTLPRSLKFFSVDFPTKEDAQDSYTNRVFEGCPNFTDIYYEGSEEEWKNIDTTYAFNGMERRPTIHYLASGDESQEPEPETPETDWEYIYDELDLGEDTVLLTDLLDGVRDEESAAEAVRQQTQSMTDTQRNSATGIDLATLYADAAIAKAASKRVEGREIIINRAAVTDLEAVAARTSQAVETALVNGGVTTARYLSNCVTLTTDETGEITIRIDPDILTTRVDKIRVETPTYALNLKTEDLADDLTEILTIQMRDMGYSDLPESASGARVISVNFSKEQLTNPLTLSLPASGETRYQAIANVEEDVSPALARASDNLRSTEHYAKTRDDNVVPSKVDPAQNTLDGKINTPGDYTIIENEKNFTDIASKSEEMQKAIRELASKNIIRGTTATTFSPDALIPRSQFVVLLMRVLRETDYYAKANFTDVTTSAWFYHEAATSQKRKIVQGYSDNTFRPNVQINKQQIIVVAGRMLVSKMKYKEPGNMTPYLSKYKDSVPEWAQSMVALATRENLVVYRKDGKFMGTSSMTRGDSAIILYRLFKKMW